MIIRIQTYKNRKGLAEFLKPQLPFYVLDKDSEQHYFKAVSMSQKYYWDMPYKLDKNGQNFHSGNAKKLAVMTDQEIYKTEEEVQNAALRRKVETVKELFPEIKNLYEMYTKFMDEYPEHFL